MSGRTLVTLFDSRVAHSPERTALVASVGGNWREMTWAEFDLLTDQVACGLISAGLKVGDRVGLLAKSCMEWVLADVGILKAGGCVVPVHANALPEQAHFVLADSGATIAFVEDEKQLAKVRCSHCEVETGRVVVMRGPASGPGEMQWEDLLATGRMHQAEFQGALKQRRKELNPGSLASIVYTSGTSGAPKGVALTHGNLVFESEALCEVMRGRIDADDVHLLCLPLSHILARIMVLASVTAGYSNAFSTGLGALERELLEIRPTFMTVVPSILEGLCFTIRQQSRQANPVIRRLVRWTRKVGEMEARQRQSREPLNLVTSLQRLVAEHLIRGPLVRDRLGKRLKFFICGGAPLSSEIATFFQSLGVIVLEGYGMTENVGAANVNRPDANRIGTVGPPIPGVEQRIAPDGEILIRGPNVMKGYYNQPHATSEAIDAAGWLHTGDLGQFEPTGHLRVTGRKKDILVTSTGKNVSPQNIEKLLTSSPFIDQAVVVGDGRRYLTALLSLNLDNLQQVAESEGLTFDKQSELTYHTRVEELLNRELEERNRQLASHEHIRKFTILPGPLTLLAGEITPTMKVRRQEVEIRYRDLIEAMYEESEVPGAASRLEEE